MFFATSGHQKLFLICCRVRSTPMWPAIDIPRAILWDWYFTGITTWVFHSLRLCMGFNKQHSVSGVWERRIFPWLPVLDVRVFLLFLYKLPLSCTESLLLSFLCSGVVYSLPSGLCKQSIIKMKFTVHLGVLVHPVTDNTYLSSGSPSIELIKHHHQEYSRYRY